MKSVTSDIAVGAVEEFSQQMQYVFPDMMVR